MDLRVYAKVHAEFPSVKQARGHFMSCPERHQGQEINDHFAVGSAGAMYAYGSRPMPYTMACGEGYVQRNINMQCMARTQNVLDEEFGGADKAAEVVAMAHQPPRKGPLEWSIVPDTHRASEFSPVINMHHTRILFGQEPCMRKAAARRAAALAAAERCAADEGECANPDLAPGADATDGCVPVYRGGFTYIYNIVTSAWFESGLVCIGRGAHYDEEVMLIEAGLADYADAAAAVKYRWGPCIHFPALDAAWELSKEWMKTISPEDRRALTELA
jgi:hypothetical protein